MGKANVDPAELRQFAKDLVRFSSELQHLVDGLKARMQHLQSNWRDQEHRKFADEFDQTIKALSKFLDTSNRHASFLIKKAGHVEEYLKQR